MKEDMVLVMMIIIIIIIIVIIINIMIMVLVDIALGVVIIIIIFVFIYSFCHSHGNIQTNNRGNAYEYCLIPSHICNQIHNGHPHGPVASYLISKIYLTLPLTLHLFEYNFFLR